MDKVAANERRTYLDRLTIEQTEKWIYIKSDHVWKTLSSGVLGAGFAHHQRFLNRHVKKQYDERDPVCEYRRFLKKHGIAEPIMAMMTAAKIEDAAIVRVPHVLVIVTAGISNAVDAARAWTHPAWKETVGTINTWVFIEGTLHDEAFVQAVMTATEAKTKALEEEKVIDPWTNTIATGTSTDSIMIAATQKGPTYRYAGTATDLGKEIGKLVFEGTTIALKRNRTRWEESE